LREKTTNRPRPSRFTAGVITSSRIAPCLLPLPHVEVDDPDAGLRAAMILDDGALIELMEFSPRMVDFGQPATPLT